MLLDSHELNIVVSSLLNSFKVMISKINICANTTEFLCHTHMSFINSHTLFWLINGSLMSPLEFLFWIPPKTIKQETRWVLYCHTCPSRVSIFLGTIPFLNIYFVLGVMRNSTFAIKTWNCYVKTTKIILSCFKLLSVPVVKLSKD